MCYICYIIFWLSHNNILVLIQHRVEYFAQCHTAIQKWKEAGPQPLNNEGLDVDGKKLEGDAEYTSGLWLFTDRENISHFFAPNFLPPYDTPEKRQIILHFLKEEWDEKSLSWRSAGDKRTEFDEKLDGILKKIGLGYLTLDE